MSPTQVKAFIPAILAEESNDLNININVQTDANEQTEGHIYNQQEFLAATAEVAQLASSATAAQFQEELAELQTQKYEGVRVG